MHDGLIYLENIPTNNINFRLNFSFNDWRGVMDIFKLLFICLFALVSFNVHAFDFRVEAQAGGTDGDIEAEPLGGPNFEKGAETGAAVGGAVWLDGVLLPALSVGAQYSYIFGNDLETDPSPDKIEFDTHVAMINVVFRDNEGTLDGKFHPYAGGGIGFSRVNAQYFLAGVEGDDIDFAGQFMAGFDYDILKNIYFGVNFTYLFNQAEIQAAGIPTTTYDFQTIKFMGVLGMKF